MSETSVALASAKMVELRESLRKRRRLWNREPREQLPREATRWNALISTAHSNGFSLDHCKELRSAIEEWDRRTSKSHAAVRAVITLLENSDTPRCW